MAYRPRVHEPQSTADFAPPLIPEPGGQLRQPGSVAVKPVFTPVLYLPIAHVLVQFARDMDPSVVVVLPATGHTRQAGSGAEESDAGLIPVLYFPTGQLIMQSAEEDDPKAALVLPLGHTEQDVIPAEDVYLPRGHLLQPFPGP